MKQGYLGRLLSSVAARQRRRRIRALMKDVDIRELSWMPSADSPLAYQGTLVHLAMDYVIGPRTLAFGHWHDEHCDFIRDRLRKDQPYHLVDVGANAGLVSRQLLASRGLQFEGADCFEPDAANFALLQANLAPFRGITLHAAGLSDSDGEAALFRGARNSGDISLTPDADLLSRGDIGSQSVRLLSAERMARQILASLAPATRLVWKSDTQGHDLKIVANVPLEFWNRVDVALVEVRSVAATPQEIERFLAVAESFPIRRSVKHGEKDISLAWLRNFVESASGHEFDLLLVRK